MKLTDSQKRIYDVLNRTNLTDRDKAILISQIQEKLVSGENISTINGEDITKGGNIEIQGSGGSDIVFKGDYDAENNPAATIQDVKDEISEELYDELQTNDKTIIGSINEVDTNLKSAVKPYVINLTDLLAADNSQSISTAIGGIDNLNGTVKKNQVIFGTLANGTVAVGIRVLGNKTTLTYFVDSVVGLTVNEVIITNTSGTLTKTANTHAVLTENMVINNLESDETTLPLSAAQGKVLKEDVEANSYKQYLHKIYESYGAVYNADTGYWELNGLTDLTEEDMWVIYLAGVPRTDDLVEFYVPPIGSNKSIRTTFNYTFKGGGTGTGTILRGTFMECGNLEVVQIYESESTPIYVRELLNAFYNCQKLRKIVNILQVYSSTLSTNNTFYNCKALESVKLSRLRTDISFKDSPLLSYESIKYLVDNAANTAAITVTVHPTTYSYLTGTAQPTVEVGGTTEEWQALVTTAQGKQISFAVPEETQSEVTE